MFTNMSIWSCNLGGATEMFWHSPEGWRLASHQTYYPGEESNPSCIEVIVNAEGTSPTIGDLSGTYFAPGADISAPTLSLPPAVSVEATDANGAIVTYAATATDDTDPAPVLTCTPGSGTLFPPGQTVVTCTATDAVGNDVSGSFTVTVTQAVASGRMTGSGFVEEGDARASLRVHGRPDWDFANRSRRVLGDRSRAGTPWAAACVSNPPRSRVSRSRRVRRAWW